MPKSFQSFLRPRAIRCTPCFQRRCFSGTRIQYNNEPEDVIHQPKHRQEDQPRKLQSNSRPPVQTKYRSPIGLDPDSLVELQIDGQPHRFSPILLRDLCQCPQCVDPSTKQKFRPTTDIPPAIKACGVTQSKSGVNIAWEDDIPGYGEDHTTNIGIDTLRDYAESGVTGIATSSLGPRSLWDADEYKQISDMSYEEYMQSDSALYNILDQLHTHGLAFLTDVPESEKSVSTIAERIGPVKNTFYGYTWDVRSVPESKNVAYTSQDLGFHMDLLYMEQPPHLQFLHCIRSSAAGGASLFTDSYRAISDLLATDVDTVKRLHTHPVNFHYNHPSSALYHQRRFVIEFESNAFKGALGNMLAAYKHAMEARDRGETHPFAGLNPIDHLTGVAWSPPFQAPMGQRLARNEARAALGFTNQRVDEWHGAALKFNEMIHRPEMVYERMMKPGECVLFDNRRVLHARKAFEVGDAGKERWLRGAYLDKDPYMSKLRVLKHQLGQEAGGNVQEESTLGKFSDLATAFSSGNGKEAVVKAEQLRSQPRQ